MTKHAKEKGAKASLQVAPYYNKPTQEGFYQHFKKIADEVDLPMIIYNIPGRSGKNIETSTIKRLAAHKNVVAVKEASGSLPQMMDVVDQCGNNLNVLSGDDNLTLPLISIGGKGVISVASNIVPDKMKAMVDEALIGEMDNARKKHYELMPLFKAEFLETNPIPIKAACARLGMCEEIYRLPMCYMEDSNKEKLFKVMDDMGIKKE
jgi:4-hydroxy-tetrahydrodipicolinate synthase